MFNRIKNAVSSMTEDQLVYSAMAVVITGISVFLITRK